jgi:hypothetical protein
MLASICTRLGNTEASKSTSAFLIGQSNCDQALLIFPAWAVAVDPPRTVLQSYEKETLRGHVAIAQHAKHS